MRILNSKELVEIISEFRNVSETGDGILDIFLTGCIDLNAIDDVGLSPLHFATREKNHYAIKKLLQHGANPNILERRHTTPPIYAMKREDTIEMIEELLENETKPNVFNRCNATPLIYAIKRGDTAAMNLFFEKDVDVDINKKDTFGKGPLVHAIRHRHPEAVRLLLTKGAQCDMEAMRAAVEAGISYVEILLDHGVSVSYTNEFGDTFLIMAVVEDRIDVVKFLLERGADINQKGGLGISPLTSACLHGNTKIFHLLFGYVDENGNSVDVNQQTDFGTTALSEIVSKRNNENIMELLLERGADPSIADKRGDNTLHHAVGGENENIIRMILATGIDVNLVNLKGQTASEMAASQEIVAIIQSNLGRFTKPVRY